MPRKMESTATAAPGTAREALMKALNGDIVVIEGSNPGPVGQDTGYEFRSPRTGQIIRVIAKEGEPHSEAIERVKANHGA